MNWLNRRYRLEEPIGAGGSGVVWRAYDLRLRRHVAVKTSTPGRATARHHPPLEDEAVLTAGLNHPNIVAVYDYGETSNGIPFIVLELIDGRTLAHVLAKHGPLSPVGTVSVCGAVASALATVHDHGLVHGDVKPDNVMLCRTGPKLLDLGTARRIGTDHRQRRRVASGTPASEALEAVGCGHTATDIHAFGRLLQECLTARQPLSDVEPADVPDAHGGWCPGIPATVPARLRELLTACLTSDPTRQPTAAQAAATLRASAGRRAPTPRRRRTRRRPGNRVLSIESRGHDPAGPDMS